MSQSVDLDHPLMLDFLRKDCERLIEFFQKKGACDWFSELEFSVFLCRDGNVDAEGIV